MLKQVVATALSEGHALSVKPCKKRPRVDVIAVQASHISNGNFHESHVEWNLAEKVHYMVSFKHQHT